MSTSPTRIARGSKPSFEGLFRASAIVVAAIVLLTLWYSTAANYDYAALAGTYRFHDKKIRCTLKLHEDRTFQQTVEDGASLKQANGTWRRIGEGGVDFSVEFLPIPGAKTFVDEFPGKGDGSSQDQSYYGRFEKLFGLYPLLRLNANPPGPTLYKVPFSEP